MNFLADERRTLNRFLPGLDEKLSALDLLRLESPGGSGIEFFRTLAGPGLLIPREYSGLGANALEAVQIQRAIGSRSPSLAIATTMHHFSVATLVSMCSGVGGLEWMLLQAIAEQNLLVASGFAEGQSGRSMLKPSMQGRKTAHGAVISGSKKPCSLSRSMNLLTASVTISDGTEESGQFAIVLIPSDSEGIERRPYWNSFVLAGAESDEIVLQDVFVPERLIFYASENVRGLNESLGFLWFELLVSASYLGAASAMVERVIQAARGTPHDRCLLAIELEAAMAGLEGSARALMSGERGGNHLARVLFVRYAIQRAIERATALAAEAMGGMAFVGSSDISYLYAAARALSLHPPSRLAASCGLATYLGGGDLRLE